MTVTPFGPYLLANANAIIVLCSFESPYPQFWMSLRDGSPPWCSIELRNTNRFGGGCTRDARTYGAKVFVANIGPDR